MFYTWIFCTNIGFGSFFLVTCTFPKRLSYEKFVCLTLMKLSPAVNFINIFHVFFSYERHFSSYVLALSKKLYKNAWEKRWWNWHLIYFSKPWQHGEAFFCCQLVCNFFPTLFFYSSERPLFSRGTHTRRNHHLLSTIKRLTKETNFHLNDH